MILDGAMGTEIEKQGYDTSSFLWSAQILLDNPSVVQEIHNEYFKADADIIVTNTFRVSPYSFKKAGYDENLSTKAMFKAIELAVNAKEESNKEGLIFGSIASLEDCFRPDLAPKESILEEFHQKTLETMDRSSDIELILFETHNNFKEIEVISSLINQLDHPVGLSLTLNNKGELLDGTSWKKVVGLLENSNFSLFGVNCSSPTIITKGLQKLNETTQLVIPIIAYANIGLVDPITNQLNDNITGNDYLNEAVKWLDLGASIIGSCCGSDPKVTRNLVNRFKN
jgi:homocysteine S-methyltransferase